MRHRNNSVGTDQPQTNQNNVDIRTRQLVVLEIQDRQLREHSKLVRNSTFEKTEFERHYFQVGHTVMEIFNQVDGPFK